MYIVFSMLALCLALLVNLSDPLHPTWSDYKKMQAYIERKERPELQLLNEAIIPGGTLYNYAERARKFRLIGKKPWEKPIFGVVHHNCSSDDKSIAICTYASYNHNYPKGVELIQDALKKVGFKGHFIYRIGGWPDTEGGSIKLAHIPYAFKPCFFRELARLGYAQILWIDTSIRPVNSLQRAFDVMAEQGYFVQGDGQLLGQYCSRAAAEALQAKPEEIVNWPSIGAGVIGLDMRHPNGKALLDRWYMAAEQETPFLSPRPEQNALSILLHQMNLKNWESPPTLVWNFEQCNERTLFVVDHASIR